MKQLTFYAPIDKTDKKEQMVYGYASTEAVDSQDEIVKKDALANALNDYMKYANIREMHQPSAVGKTKSATIDKKGLYIAAKIVDPMAWKKVEEGVYNGFSIGGRVETMVDNEITALKLSEISLVDRPANPEATFDVWKRDDTADKTEVKKDVWGASRLVNLACDLNGYITQQRYENKDTAQFETALQTIKDAVVMELGEDENYPDAMTECFAYAEKVLDLKKADEPKPANPEAVTVVNEEVKEEVTEPTDEALETVETEVAEEKAEVEESADEEKTEEVVAEESEETVEEEAEKVEKTPEELLLEKTTKTLEEFKMPSDEDITQMLKFAEIEATPRAISVMKYELAGKIVENIEKSRKEQFEKDAVVNKMKKEQAKVDKVDALVGNKEILALVETLEAQLKKEDGAAYDADDVATLPASKESPTSPAEVLSAAIATLQAAIDKLNEESTSQNLTATEEEKLRNGVVAGSERTSKDRVRDENKVNERAVRQPVTTFQTAGPENPSVPMKSEDTGDLAKLDNEIALLKAEIEKIKSMPMPVTVKASYATVEKFESGDDPAQTRKELLAKIDKVSAELKERPSDPVLVKQANDLSAEWMKLSREDNASNN